MSLVTSHLSLLTWKSFARHQVKVLEEGWCGREVVIVDLGYRQAEILHLVVAGIEALKNGRVVRVLLEMHIAEEETKYGLTLDACRELLASGEWRDLTNVKICGLMMMASYVEDAGQIKKEMLTAADFFDEVKARYFADDDDFCERSWGMSHDYRIAVDCRSTMVRVGTTIFGERVY